MFFDNEITFINHPADMANKAITSARDGLDVLMSVIFQSLSEHRDVLRQVTFLNKRVRPDLAHQPVLLDHPAAVLNQQKKEIEQLRGQRYKLAFSQQHPLHRIHSERSKLETALCVLFHNQNPGSFEKCLRNPEDFQTINKIASRVSRNQQVRGFESDQKSSRAAILFPFETAGQRNDIGAG